MCVWRNLMWPEYRVPCVVCNWRGHQKDTSKTAWWKSRTAGRWHFYWKGGGPAISGSGPPCPRACIGTIPSPNSQWTLAVLNKGILITFLVNIWTSEVFEQRTFQSLHVQHLIRKQKGFSFIASWFIRLSIVQTGQHLQQWWHSPALMLPWRWPEKKATHSELPVCRGSSKDSVPQGLSPRGIFCTLHPLCPGIPALRSLVTEELISG